MAEGHCPRSFICPVTFSVMRDPVICADGHSYEREAIVEWHLTHDTSPVTNVQLPDKTLAPNHALRNAIEEWSSSFAKAFKVVPRDAITIGRQIGRGSFKAVHEGTYKGGRVAVLKLRAGSCEAEVATLVRLGRRQGLVQYLGMCRSEGEQLLLTEYAPHGSLDKLLEAEQEARAAGLSLAHKLAMMRQVCAGMQALAVEGMVHRDLAARNVLVFRYDPNDPSATRAKVSDFGLAVSASLTAVVPHTPLTSPHVPFYIPVPVASGRRCSDSPLLHLAPHPCGGDFPVGSLILTNALFHALVHFCEGGYVRPVVPLRTWPERPFPLDVTGGPVKAAIQPGLGRLGIWRDGVGDADRRGHALWAYRQ